VSDRDALLALLRRVKRRSRAVAALNGGARALAVGAPALAAVAVLGSRLAHLPRPSSAALLAATLVLGALGMLVGLARRHTPRQLARRVDRAAARGDDLVLSAWALVDSRAEDTSFGRAVVAEAARRTRETPLGRAVAWPRPRLVVSGIVGVALVAVAGLLPAPRVRAASPVAARAHAPDARPQSRADDEGRLQVPEAALLIERDEARRAARAAAAGDDTLAALARELGGLLDALSGRGLDAAEGIARLQRLADEAARAARLAEAARVAAATGRKALGARGAAGEREASGLLDAAARALETPGGAASGGAAIPAGAALDSVGQAGATALGAAARAAGAALAASDAAAPTADAGARGTPGGARSPRDTSGEAAAGAPPPSDPDRRRLESLRRDLDDAAEACARQPEACRRRAGDTARALSQLQRQGQTAGARDRLAEAARQLTQRLQQGSARADDGPALQRFSRAAEGASSSGGPSDTSGSGASASANADGTTSSNSSSSPSSSA